MAVSVLTHSCFSLCTQEFYLQTLVKRHFLGQARMLLLQRALMVLASLAAAQLVWSRVRPLLALLSAALNFVWRKHDVANGALVILAAAVLY